MNEKNLKALKKVVNPAKDTVAKQDNATVAGVTYLFYAAGTFVMPK